MTNKKYTPKTFNPRKGRASMAAKQAFADMRRDDVTLINIEIFGGTECQVHTVLDESIIDVDIDIDIDIIIII